MSKVLKIYNLDGSFNRVDLYPPVQAQEVVNAISSRHQVSQESAASYALYVVTTWEIVAADGAGSNSQVQVVEFRVRKLGPNDRPLHVSSVVEEEELGSTDKVRHDLEASEGARIRKRITFCFCDLDGEALLRQNGDSEIIKGKEARILEQQSKARLKNSDKDNQFLGLGSALHHGGDSTLRAYLLKRSSRNSREWQRHWCVLRHTGLFFGPGQASKMTCIPLTHNTVQKSTTLKNCFELHTAQTVELFRTKTGSDCNLWVEQIQRNIDLASDNELFILADYMIVDEEKSASLRFEDTLEKVTASVEGLLSYLAGAKALLKFCRSQSSSSNLDDTRLIMLYLNIERA
mmetsp:Transcript_8702/g.11321  ORF Transcript_8702/g.11321 Transcript_8702/m.11321 type:complete len:347 (+) Transcript_8702:423-1463(+)